MEALCRHSCRLGEQPLGSRCGLLLPGKRMFKQLGCVVNRHRSAGLSRHARWCGGSSDKLDFVCWRDNYGLACGGFGQLERCCSGRYPTLAAEQRRRRTDRRYPVTLVPWGLTALIAFMISRFAATSARRSGKARQGMLPDQLRDGRGLLAARACGGSNAR
jgi:hypothetical protein